MHVFGLTGGVASGKSAVAEHFERLATPVIDADQLARLAVAPPSPELDAIVERFGVNMLTSGGTLDRRALAAQVFGDPKAVEALNNIVHPRVARLLAEQLDLLERQGHELVCYSAPLLFENHIADRFRPVVLVAAPEHLQISRAQQRDGWTEAQTRARIAAQLPLEHKRSQADFVIENGGTLEQLQAQAHTVLSAIRERFAGAGREP
jgi:dephospho-CoA kinase